MVIPVPNFESGPPVGQRRSAGRVPPHNLEAEESLLGAMLHSKDAIATALGTATHAALSERRPVVFFSMEMGYLELTQRILAAEAAVDSRLLRTGRIPETDWQKISRAVGRLAEAP